MNQLNPQHLQVRPYARVAVADALPGHCIRCPRNSDLLDLGAPGIPNFGVVYLCTVCLGDLMAQMKVVGHEQYQAVIDSARERESILNEQLAQARAASAAPVTFIRDNLEEFSNDIDRSARDLLARLAGYAPADPGPAAPAGDPRGDRVAAVVEQPVEPRAAEPADVVRDVDPGERAGEGERPAPVPERAAGADDGDRLVAALLGVPSAPRAPQPADAGRDDDADGIDEPSDGLSLLYGEADG